MARVKNLEFQPLVLDLGKDSIRFNSREEKSVDDKLLTHRAFEINKNSLHIVAEPKTQKKTTKETTKEKTSK